MKLSGVKTMANLDIQGKRIEMKTNSYNHCDYYADISFNTPESENSEYCKSLEIPLKGDSKSDLPFSEIEEQINDFLNRKYPDMEIIEFLRMSIVEKTTIKKRPYDNYEY